MVGGGTPSAIQWNVTTEPSLTVWFSGPWENTGTADDDDEGENNFFSF